jgi:predicted NBD/HSP70 family sugar kinase
LSGKGKAAINKMKPLKCIMINVAIITRKLREGKSYEDFRKAWFHSTGFGVQPGGNRMFTAINMFDPREIIVVGLTETTPEQIAETLNIEVTFRLDHSLDDIIEPEIGRKFGILVAEDDFSSAGDIVYKPPAIGGKETDLEALFGDVSRIAEQYTRAMEEREKGRAKRKST